MKIINNFLFQFNTDKLEPTSRAGIIHQMPLELLKLSPADVDTSFMGAEPRRHLYREPGPRS